LDRAATISCANQVRLLRIVVLTTACQFTAVLDTQVDTQSTTTHQPSLPLRPVQTVSHARSKPICTVHIPVSLSLTKSRILWRSWRIRRDHIWWKYLRIYGNLSRQVLYLSNLFCATSPTALRAEAGPIKSITTLRKSRITMLIAQSLIHTRMLTNG
jgi:hypothetical protein